MTRPATATAKRKRHSSKRPESLTTPGRQGYRWPAEWEEHRATWLTWPHNAETWPTGLAPVEDAFCEIVRALIPQEEVEIHVEGPAMAERVRARLAGSGVEGRDRIRFHFVASDDAWIRDHGGIFLVRSDLEASDSRMSGLVLDFEFDAWGGKYPPWDRDAGIARSMAEAVGLRCIRSSYVLEAGSIDGDGQGTILTTESCLLNPNRGRAEQDRSRDGIESLLADMLGAKRVLWLGEGIEGDDTDGHVDDLTRFVGSGRVVTIVEADRMDPNHSALADNRRRLEGLRDAADRRLEVIELPTPGQIEGRGGRRLPASYANFYVANASVLVPVFDAAADGEALRILAGCFPDRRVVPIPSRELIEGLGALHCLTQQEPAAARSSSWFRAEGGNRDPA